MDNMIEVRPGRRINLDIYPNPRTNDTAFLIHGLGGHSKQWRKQVDLLNQKYTLIMPDLLGHGKSDKPNPVHANPYTFLELDKDLQAIFTKFSSEKNIVIGHSYGGALAASLTLDHQDKINKLILLAPTPCTPKIQIPWIYHLPTPILALFRPWLEKQFQRMAFSAGADSALLTEEMRAMQENQLYVIKGMINGFSAMPRVDTTMFTVSTSVMTSEQDGVVPAEGSKNFYSGVPHVQFSTITNASHMLMLEQPEQVNKLIIDFLG